ncbi:hypothetical protein [Baaleninema simplex]|uniref:hypothetical protein n=1 Tax=Baaleninema simplex TaxID=2862350 RepID=UPI0003790919|nr:hypothetical protein [Baaleninema simplex]
MQSIPNARLKKILGYFTVTPSSALFIVDSATADICTNYELEGQILIPKKSIQEDRYVISQAPDGEEIGVGVCVEFELEDEVLNNCYYVDIPVYA